MTSKRIRRALVVAYVFPPSGGAGVQRVTKFVKYLPQFGWDCSVLTVSNPSVPLRDESMLAEIPESTVIRKAKTYEPGYAFKNAVSASSAQNTGRKGLKSALKGIIRSIGNAVLHPDAQLLWYPQAVKEGLRLLKELHHDCIFVTAPPFSSFLVGAALSRATGLPLVLDYRDEWGISNRYQENRQKSGLAQRLQERQQQRVLREAKAVIATTRRSAASLREVIQRANSRATVTQIYNGYDAADVRGARSNHIASSASASSNEQPLETASDVAAENGYGLKVSGFKLFRIVYVGTLWNLTSIEPVVEALLRICHQAPGIGSQIELVVAGRRTSEQDALLDRLNGMPCRVVREDYVEHARAIEIMRSADALCLLLSNVEEAARVMPAKTFEYLALQRPILAIAPAGEVTELLGGCPYASTFSPTDVDNIAEHLAVNVTNPDLALVRGSWNYQQYERRELTGQLARLFNDVCGFESEIPLMVESTDDLEPLYADAPDWGGTS